MTRISQTTTRIYRGRRTSNGDWEVRVHEGSKRIRPLRKRLDLFNHSPDGFSWGYGGSGPAQLALALLADATGDDRLAVRLHQPYKRRVIAALDQNKSWEINADAVRAFAAAHREHAIAPEHFTDSA